MMPASPEEAQLYGALSDEDKAAVGAAMRNGADPSSALRKVAGGGLGTSAARGFAQGATLGFADEAAGVGAAAGARTEEESTGQGLLRLAKLTAPFALGPLGIPLSTIAAADEVRTDAARPEYAQGRDEARLRFSASRAENPKATGAAQMAGALLPGALLRGAGPSVAGAPSGAPLALRMIASGKAAAIPGAVIGGLAGVGGAGSLDPTELAKSVGGGAALGGAGGLLLGGAAPAVGAAGGAALRFLQNGAGAARSALGGVAGTIDDAMGSMQPAARGLLGFASHGSSEAIAAAAKALRPSPAVAEGVPTLRLADDIGPLANEPSGLELATEGATKPGGVTMQLAALKERMAADPARVERILKNLDAGNTPAQAAKIEGVPESAIDEVVLASRTTGGTGGTANAVVAPRATTSPVPEATGGQLPTPTPTPKSSPMMVGGQPWDPVNGPRATDAVDVPGLSLQVPTLAPPADALASSASADAGTQAARLRLRPATPSPSPTTEPATTRSLNLLEMRDQMARAAHDPEYVAPDPRAFAIEQWRKTGMPPPWAIDDSGRIIPEELVRLHAGAGASGPSIRGAVSQLPLAPSGNAPTSDEALRAEVLAAVKRGEPLKALAKRLGVTQGDIGAKYKAAQIGNL